MSVLTSIRGPGDLNGLNPSQLSQLASEIRDLLLAAVSKTAGHLGPNLGVVELTIAIHRVFDSPHDPIIFDVGHQAYVHKILTGRQAGFDRLRQRDGLSGYPNRAESPHDVVENSHASAALSWADGMARAFRLRGEHDRTVVAVVGDGALTGGMAWEALNNIADRRDERLVIVVNDNGRSYSPTIGGLANHLASLRLSHRYEQATDAMRTALERTPVIGPPSYQHLAGLKRGLKDVIAPQVLFEDLGIKYVGPIDGHDLQAVERALVMARRYGRPVIVHCLTRKGRGYPPAENDQEDCLHNPGVFDPATGRSTAQPATTWTDVFGSEMVRIGSERRDVVAVTAAMLGPLGLRPFAEAFPERLLDVGIAEAHALTMSAGLAFGGLHPVVVLYSTFLNRAFDQVLMDVALHRAPVTIVLDRAGVTGPDGPSHHGMWDLSILHTAPGIKVAAPRDGARLRQLLGQAVAETGPTALRYPKGPVPADIPAIDRLGSMDVLYRSHTTTSDRRVLLIGIGPMAGTAVTTARLLAGQHLAVTVVDPCWIRPLDPVLAHSASASSLVAVIEDHGRVGGTADAVSRLLQDADVATPVRAYTIPQEFLPHDSREHLFDTLDLSPRTIADDIERALRDVQQHATRDVEHGDQQASRVGDDEPLPAVDLLPGVVAPAVPTDGVSALHALGVDDPGRRLGVAALLHPCLDP
jgi:1-deoxy-D-xylulose-5-phosphate synthase